MQQTENVENVHSHNLDGAAPSTFNDVENMCLKHRNRGAVLANIYERYTSEDAKGNVQLTQSDFVLCTREMDKYLSGMSRRDRQHAREEMMVHLENRGFHATA